MTSFVITGYTLYAKEEENSQVAPILKVSAADNGTHRLYSCKDFQKGDVITLLSQYEESTGNLVFGGNCSRFGILPEDCNAYLTSNRALRCTKPIAKGDEILRLPTGEKAISFYERIDRVILSTEHMLLGRIAASNRTDKLTVDYVDGTTRDSDKDEGLAYCIRDLRPGRDSSLNRSVP
eukprot:CAMPEP_0113627886 /NCGR_PEP_ID=MMETSP0017_2-20120614/14445_1 /TAXON_ID=2856 /ORGANISM="Cylindrotheca closterium" /LENGTH=178 /DNA_ID=CAMNT_0000538163 /DNA_START=208 /DNA_END=744 /DNA_ORIENTATION=+ /assembly_acc=CAM_ASM_000147